MSIPRTHPVVGVSVVGPGRLGRVLTRALRAAGVPVNGPVGRGEEIPPADVVLLCVPDAAIPAAARAAARSRLIGHTSGATPIDGVDFGLHPLQTFTGDEDPAVLHGIGCAVAGRTPDALATATQLAELLGTRPFPLADEQRSAYHAAASIASNFLVTIEDAAERMAASAGIPAARARAILAPLVHRTVENWAEQGSAALTGPLVRGDEETVARQRSAVAAVPELLPLFDELCERTRALAREIRDARREDAA